MAAIYKLGRTAAFLFFWLTAAVAHSAEPIRLAVLSTVPDFAPQADLLTIGLSTADNITLLEREQIDKAWREQELTAAQRNNFLKLGRTLSADGILLLEHRVESGNELLIARLLAVKPGVIIAENRFVMPLADLADWGKSYCEKIKALMPKLRVKAADAVPLSLLNLHSSVRAPENVVPENELTALLQYRLSREPAVFVLERRRMDEFEKEKQLAPGEVEPFWNGAYVIDGILNRDVISHDTITIDARLVPPRGTVVEIKVQGRRDALGDFIDELAKKILSAINKPSTASAWDPEAEAEKFEQEAAWAWRWNLWPHAIEAADASWALGRRNPTLISYRVTPRVLLALSLRALPDYMAVPGQYEFRKPPTNETLTRMSDALVVFRDAFHDVSGRTNGPDVKLASVGLDALLASASILKQFNEWGELQENHLEVLKLLRLRAREVSSMLANEPHLGLTTWRRTIDGMAAVPFRYQIQPGGSGALFDAMLQSRGLWLETPAEWTRMARPALDSSIYPIVRNSLFSVEPPLAAWSFADRQKLHTAWLGFLRELAGSTNIQMQLDGLRLLLMHADDPSELTGSLDRFVEITWSNRLQVFCRKLDAPVSGIITNLAKRVEKWGRPDPDSLTARAVDWEKRWAEECPELSYAVWETNFNLLLQYPKTNYLFSPWIRPSKVRVQELISKFGKTEGVSPDAARRIQMELSSMSFAVGLVPRPTNSAPRLLPWEAKTSEVATLNISRRWSSKSVALSENRVLGWQGRMFNLTWSQGKIWMEGVSHRPDSSAESRPVFISLDPRTLIAQCFEAPFEQIGIPRRRSYLANDDEFYACSSDAVWRRDNRGSWTQIPVPISVGAVPYEWNKKIILSTSQSILELEPDTGDVKILASTRRNPPVNALEAAEGIETPPLAIWSKDKLCAQIGNRIWVFDRTTQDWSIMFAATNCANSLELQTDGILFRQPGNCSGYLLGGVHPGSSQFEYYTWSDCGSIGQGDQVPAFTPPVWIHPDNSRPHDSVVAFDGAGIWVFPESASGFYQPMQVKRNLSGSALKSAESWAPEVTLYLDRRYNRSLPLILRQAYALSSSETNAERGAFVRGREYLQTPDGLAILVSSQQELVWAPRDEIDQALADSAQRMPGFERADYADWQRFDADHDGWLDDVERRAMSRDPVILARQKGIEAQRAAALSSHGAEWDALFTQLDHRKDGVISIRDLAYAFANKPELFQERLRGVNAGWLQVIRPFDMNNDEVLDKAEFRLFMADPLPFSEANLSPDWVTRFGFTIEESDTNGDGVLGDDERQRVNARIDQKLGRASAKRN